MKKSLREKGNWIYNSFQFYGRNIFELMIKDWVPLRNNILSTVLAWTFSHEFCLASCCSIMSISLIGLPLISLCYFHWRVPYLCGFSSFSLLIFPDILYIHFYFGISFYMCYSICTIKYLISQYWISFGWIIGDLIDVVIPRPEPDQKMVMVLGR